MSYNPLDEENLRALRIFHSGPKRAVLSMHTFDGLVEQARRANRLLKAAIDGHNFDDGSMGQQVCELCDAIKSYRGDP